MLGRLTTFFGTVLAMVAAPLALADWELNMPRGVTSITQEIYGLHMLIFWVCVIIGIVVFGAMAWSIVYHRKSRNPEPATFSHSTRAEIIWTVIPVVILVSIAYPAAKTLIVIEDSGSPDMTVKVTGYQWKWQYEYLEEGINFFSTLAADSNRARQLGSGEDVFEIDNYLLEVDNPLVIPVNKKVRLLLTSNDVLHAWWVPELSGKRDAIPGFVNTLWFETDKPGTYRGQCAELCGRDHGFMPIVVEVKSEQDYAAWLDAQGVAAGQEAERVAEEAVADWNRETLMARGEEVYGIHCVACHQANGQGLPPTFPAIAGSAVANGDLTAHTNLVLNGKAGTAMAAFGSLLSDAEVASVITYQRNAFGNDAGDVVMPEDIAARR